MSEFCLAIPEKLRFVTLELGSIERITLTCCGGHPFLSLFQCWPRRSFVNFQPCSSRVAIATAAEPFSQA